MEKRIINQDRFELFDSNFNELELETIIMDTSLKKQELDLHTKILTIISALISAGNFEELEIQLILAKKNGVPVEKVSEVITQVGFYCSWPSALKAFSLTKKVYKS
ncbi:carboxymuconolactone decarboxylase family protein [Enterococcus thailandicus]|uniref:carboxymuconolactone decarboxylase family protein n=1 Tax=Enterococcus thailandicus TaxID=417368 RepID=UPI0022EBD46B|nr:carboxymuconolactone decarboxylase family protein [Enterococcus thailandicus]MDA3972749.1 carboxymuconolactone decarboxylase family protein [Enterococcus thailandicus]MDA3975245.1 carboxymuconolactone decarboxylase family protein [Enterococcus thailandicus]MDA3980209.1 carboxymuconolactone decarboxylase family protein [Enterococcus thailandicus]